MTTYYTYPRRIRALTAFTMMDDGISGFLVKPGEVIDISPNMYGNTYDANDDNWLDLTPAQQIAKWGHQRFEIVKVEGH